MALRLAHGHQQLQTEKEMPLVLYITKPWPAHSVYLLSTLVGTFVRAKLAAFLTQVIPLQETTFVSHPCLC